EDGVAAPEDVDGTAVGPGPRDVAQHHAEVGVAPQPIELQADLVGQPGVVTVEQGNVAAPRPGHPPVAGGRYTGIGLPLVADPIAVAFAEHPVGAVGGPVVDDDD